MLYIFSVIFVLLVAEKLRKMTKILLSCVRWIRFTGIVSTADIGSVPVWESKWKKQCARIATDLRLSWHILMCVSFLAPRVVMIKLLSELLLIDTLRGFTDRIHVSTDCRCHGNDANILSSNFSIGTLLAVDSTCVLSKRYQ